MSANADIVPLQRSYLPVKRNTMLEVRGIADYKQFSHLSGKSRRGEGDGADFRQLIHADEDGNSPSAVVETQSVSGDGLVPVSEGEGVMYDFSGRLSVSGDYVGRKINVEI